MWWMRAARRKTGAGESDPVEAQICVVKRAQALELDRDLGLGVTPRHSD